MTNKNDTDPVPFNLETILQRLTDLSESEFLHLGADGLSYIRCVENSNSQANIAFSLHGADGSHIATGPDIETLHVIAKQQNLIPMTVQ